MYIVILKFQVFDTLKIKNILNYKILIRLKKLMKIEIFKIKILIHLKLINNMIY